MRRPKIIAVDFDGTLCDEEYPLTGKPKEDTIKRLIREKFMGAKIILWTCREGELLNEALKWCEDQGIEFDAVNSNLPDEIEKWGTDPRKIAADEYWDDRAIFMG